MKVNHLLLTLLFSNEIFLTFNFLTSSDRSGLAHTELLTDYPMLHMNFFHKMALHYMFIGATSSLLAQKNHFCNLTCVISCAFQTQPILTFQNQVNMQIVTPLLLIPTKIHYQKLLYHQLHPITILQLLFHMTTHLLNYMTTHLSKR